MRAALPAVRHVGRQRLRHQHIGTRPYITVRVVAVALLGAAFAAKKALTFIPGTAGAWVSARLVAVAPTLDGREAHDYGSGVRVPNIPRGQASARVESGSATKPLPAEASADNSDPDRDEVNRAYFDLEKQDLSVRWQWSRFCSQHGLSSFNRSEVDVEMMKDFLTSYIAGKIQRVEVATPEVGESFQELQSTDFAVAWHWAEYIASVESYGIRDPRKLPLEIVQEFLARYTDGAFPELKLASKQTISQLYRFKRRMKPAQWRQLCAAHCLGVQDPRSFTADGADRMLSDCQKIDEEDAKRRKQQDRKTAGSPKKRELHQAVMKRLRRNPLADDIIFTVQEANGRFTSTVELTTAVLPVDQRDGVSTLSFTGQQARYKKEAVDSAAGMALAELFPQEAEELEKKMNAAQPARQRLSNAVMKFLTRPPQKDDIQYELRSKRAPFVADVFLTKDLRDTVGDIPLHFVGSESDDQKQAMDHAAELALRAILESAGEAGT